jgi:tetratricopeptide (TPR) repeat protein
LIIKIVESSGVSHPYIFGFFMSKILALFAATTMLAASAPAAYSVSNSPAEAVTSTKIANQEDYMAVYERAMQKYESNDLKGALTEFNTVIKLKPDFASAYVNRGNIRDDLGDPTGALDDYSKALKIDSRDHNTFFNRGITYSRLERYNEAINDFKKSISLKMDYAPAYRGLGVARFYSASDLSTKQSAIDDVKKSADLYRRQGQEAKAKETDEVVERMKSAIKVSG